MGKGVLERERKRRRQASLTGSGRSLFSVRDSLAWTLLRQRPEHLRPSASGPAYQRVEAEDAPEAAYALQEAEGLFRVEGLAHSLGLPEALARQGMEALLVFGWVEEDAQGGMRLTEEGDEGQRVSMITEGGRECLTAPLQP